MSQAKHTPGPWHVTDWPGDWDGIEGVSIGIDDDEGAAGGRDHYLVTVVNGDPDELKANAHLVAAAPELLASVEHLLTIIDRQAPQLAGMMEYAAARAAIAKATGG